MENNKKAIDLGILTEDEQSGVKRVSLVEEPAIELDFRYFGKQYSFVKPSGGESQDAFISRCIPVLIKEGKPEDQAAAICYSSWEEGFAVDMPHYTADGVLYEGPTHKDASGRLMTGAVHTEDSEYLYHEDEFDFPSDTCWKGYEPIGTKPGRGGRRVPNCVPVEAMKFESYNDYPESAKNAAKRALEFRDKNPDVECGTAVGWARANQLAKGENISEETIARMASFARHLQYKDVPYTEGCGGLMVDAWGGQAGIEWASNKLKEIRGEDFDIVVEGAPYVAPYIKKKNGKAEEPITKAILMEDWSKDAYVVETILALAAELGTKEADLAKLFAMEFSNPSAGGSGTSVSAVLSQGDKKLYLYKYEGGVGPNSRDFCIGMVGLDNFYTKAQIQAMSDIAVNAGFGINGASTYSIWSFKGGPNCKHRWIQYLVTMPNGQIQIEVVKDAVGRAGQRPFDMPKRGYYSKAAFKFASEDQMILVGPAMVPDISIPRVDADGEKYFVRFSAETIKEICMKYFKEARTNDVNTDHEENSAGAYIYESWIVEDPETDKANTVYGYNVPKGTWMVTMKVDDKATWTRIKSGELRGFSIEGILMDLEELEAKKKFEDIIKIMRDK
jgi:hypothetical protein